MTDPDLLKDLTAMQLQIAQTTHALCDIFDSSRKLPQRVRSVILQNVEKDLIKHQNKIKKAQQLPFTIKIKTIKEIMKAINVVQL